MQNDMRAGIALAALGGAMAVVVYVQPATLRVPPWLMTLIALAFVLAGGTLVARARRHQLLAAWLSVAILACMAAVPAWLAFGSGERRCEVALLQGFVRLVGARPELTCRIGAGIAAVLTAGILLLAVRHALRARHAA